jgi:hypothetical protein
MQGVGIITIVEGIQKCFCMDIQRFERDSTRIRYYYTINTSGQVQIML